MPRGFSPGIGHSLFSYFDTTNKEVGDYEFDLVINYNGKMVHQKAFGSILNEEDYGKAKEESLALLYIIFGILFGLVVMVIIVFAIMLMGKSKRKDERQLRDIKELREAVRGDVRNEEGKKRG